ncbi:hypothetical protein H2201_005911 [Coniosporium apollinis]|nr:hypothetical protein H2199_006862 [Cladosporium sp. JES 115]KAJ9662830.1 hypothetical protein H2201_005911 [Coniosporium apollinis]
MPQYSEGDTVRYKPVGGPDSNTSESTGTIKKVLTEPDTVGDRHVNASDDDPRYEIENANTGKTSAIYERNILGKAE